MLRAFSRCQRSEVSNSKSSRTKGDSKKKAESEKYLILDTRRAGKGRGESA